jgi:DNA-binding MarR family transcriptional regulator
MLVAVATSKSRAALARRVWGLMFDVLMRTAPQRADSLGRRGLTPNDSRALYTLDDKGRPMRSLAEAWRCDASNATWVVGRLEKMGLAERRTLKSDRRVKLVVLTSKGAATKAELLEEFHTPPIELLDLDRSALAALADLLAHIPAHPLEPRGTSPAADTRIARAPRTRRARAKRSRRRS